MADHAIHIHASQRKPLHSGGSTFWSSNDFDVTDRDVEKARLELNESEETRTACLKKLKSLLDCDKEFFYRKEDNYVMRYLRYSKFDCKRAYSMIRKFYSFRISHPELFELPPNLESLLNTDVFRYMPYRDADGNIVFLLNFRKWNAGEMYVDEILLIFNAIADIISMSPHSQINGYVIIWDFRGASTRHLLQFMKPQKLLEIMDNFQSIHPYRIKRFVGIHSNALVRTTYGAWKYMLKKKITDRVIMLGSDMAEFHQYVNPKLLPKDYGGTLDDKECSVTELVMENLPYLKYERAHGAVSK